MEYNINLEAIAKELDFDLEDIEMLMDVFMESTLESLDSLSKAIEDNDLNQIYQSSHAIKGSSANITLMDISELAREIEYSAKEEVEIDYRLKFNLLKNSIDNIQS